MRYVVVDRVGKNRKRKKKFRRLAIVLVFVLIAALFLAYFVYRRSMTPTLLQIAQIQVEAEATHAVNEAVAAVFENVDYKSLVTVEKNSANEITMLSANASAVNSLARDTAILTQSKINALFAEAIEIPLGTLSGIPLFNDKGSAIDIEVSPVGAVNCDFSSKFEAAGINQTLHRIYLIVNSTVELVVPTMRQTIELSTSVLICETVIVGKVPETFLQGSFFGDDG